MRNSPVSASEREIYNDSGKGTPVSHDESTLLLNISDMIINDVEHSASSTLEKSGMLSLAFLFRRLASGSLTDNQAFTLLKSLVDKKTPAPVQKIEQHTVLDMGALLMDAVASNSEAKLALMATARVGKVEVMERYSMGEDLQVADRRIVSDGADAKKDDVVIWNEPDELKDLR